MTDYKITGDITVDGVGGNFGTLALSTPTDELAIVPSAATSSSIVLTLPPNTGNDEEALTTDGTGTLTWGTVPNTGAFKCWMFTIPTAQTTSSGSFNAGGWRTRSLTMVKSYPAGATELQLGVSPALAGEIRIIDGTYYCEGYVSAFDVESHISRLRIVFGATAVLGTTSFSTLTQTVSILNGVFRITGGASPKRLRLQQRCTVSKATVGFGTDAASLGPTYTPVLLTIFKFG